VRAGEPLSGITETVRRWGDSDRFVPSRIYQPIQRLLALETAGGVVMLLAAIVALVWANSPAHESYFGLWEETRVSIHLGEGFLHLDLSVREFINDVLMTFFFYLAALEIKHELVHGTFRDRRAAALPAIAAMGGMIGPALVFTAFNLGGPGVGGWGIPMATDIAFAVAVVTLAGSRIPLAARMFLLAFAVADDIGGILVIAVFYTDSVQATWLAAAALAAALSFGAQRLGIRSYAPYLGLGAIAWFALHESGVHATIAGVVLGFITPASPFYAPRVFAPAARSLVDRVAKTAENDHPHDHTGQESNDAQASLRDLVRLGIETMSPLERHLAWAGPWVTFTIVPLFALANAGVRVVGGEIGNPLQDPVVLGIVLGLVIGKSVGITLASLIAVLTGVAKLPSGVTWTMVVGLATTGGVGFTVALFVTNLAFEGNAALIDQAKLGVLVGSLIAGVLGFSLLRVAAARRTESTDRVLETGGH